MKLRYIFQKIKYKFKRLLNFLSRKKYKERKENDYIRPITLKKYSIEELEFEDEGELDYMLGKYYKTS
jgi:hypothetical protein